MSPKFLLSALWAGVSIPIVNAQSNEVVSRASLAAQTEVTAIESARTAAKRGDDNAADTGLMSAGRGELASRPSSMLLARRAAAVCALLANDNEHGRAMQLAERTLRQLARMEEKDPVDRAERLYWEAWLVGRVLDRKTAALELLRTAEQLAPDDDRIINLQFQLLSAVAEFGR